MRILIPIVALGLLAAVLIFAKEKPAPKREEKPAGEDQQLIDVNKASAEDFTRLPGIGPKLAQRIVSFRKKHGPFRRVEDLLAIQGIGYGKWKAIRPQLRLGPSDDESKSAPATGEGPRQN
ncbi:MAG TPA: helix-hairpin-helix domain-containing protein [Terriglobia bacterium]|nr:helix-hairpin-helix domain-containing protein [Terriglobia bacterium]